jgi:hypothetical protein
MPRKIPPFLPGVEDTDVNCFAFSRTRSGRSTCSALDDVYCLKSDKPCAFFATPTDAECARLQSDLLRASHGINCLMTVDGGEEESP